MRTRSTKTAKRPYAETLSAAQLAVVFDAWLNRNSRPRDKYADRWDRQHPGQHVTAVRSAWSA